MKPVTIRGKNSEIRLEDMSVSGLSRAWHEASAAGDTASAEKIRAIYELAALEEDLELTEGEPGVPQLGGAHREVQGRIPGFHSHHIPAKSAQGENERLLPTIAMSAEDHRRTDSYGKRANTSHESFLPDVLPGETYKAESAGMIREGRYTELVRDELYNVREACGHKYDGAVSQYLDAAAAYIAEHGVPEAMEAEREEKGKEAGSKLSYSTVGTFDGKDVGVAGNVIGDPEAARAYEEYYTHQDEYHTVAYAKEDQYMAFTNPNKIEGVHVPGVSDRRSRGGFSVESPESFWQMRPDGSHERYLELTSHIPEINDRLAGKSPEEQEKIISELRSDERLGSCSSICYAPENRVKVWELGDIYEMDSSGGRHRILAARENMEAARAEAMEKGLPFDESRYALPVQVVGALEMEREETRDGEKKPEHPEEAAPEETRETVPDREASRQADMEEVLQNYRENLRERGVGEEQIDSFVDGERAKMEREYRDLDSGAEDPYIYHDPQNWDEVSETLKAGREWEPETGEAEGPAEDSGVPEEETTAEEAAAEERPAAERDGPTPGEAAAPPEEAKGEAVPEGKAGMEPAASEETPETAEARGMEEAAPAPSDEMDMAPAPGWEEAPEEEMSMAPAAPEEASAETEARGMEEAAPAPSDEMDMAPAPGREETPEEEISMAPAAPEEAPAETEARGMEEAAPAPSEEMDMAPALGREEAPEEEMSMAPAAPEEAPAEAEARGMEEAATTPSEEMDMAPAPGREEAPEAEMSMAPTAPEEAPAEAEARGMEEAVTAPSDEMNMAPAPGEAPAPEREMDMTPAPGEAPERAEEMDMEPAPAEEADKEEEMNMAPAPGAEYAPEREMNMAPSPGMEVRPEPEMNMAPEASEERGEERAAPSMDTAPAAEEAPAESAESETPGETESYDEGYSY